MQEVQTLSKSSGYIEAGTVAKVSLNIYGPSDTSGEIAVELSRNGLFLQDPDSAIDGCFYSNPQYLELPAQASSCEATDDIVPRKGLLQGAAQLSEAKATTDEISEPVDVDMDINFDRLLDDFARHDGLGQATVDPKIETNLLE